MIYMNDCSIRVVQSCIKIFMQEIFIQILHTKIIYNKKANYGIMHMRNRKKEQITKKPAVKWIALSVNCRVL